MTGPSGVISFPGTGQSEYKSNLDCYWTITVDVEMTMMIQFDSIGIEEADDCGYDYVQVSLRKLANAINRDFLSFKIENFQLKKFDIFLIFAQNIDCGYTLGPPRRGGSNEYPQSMFWSKNKKNTE